MENLLEDFYINLEETRNHLSSFEHDLLVQIQSQSQSQNNPANDTEAQALHIAPKVIHCHQSLHVIYSILQSMNDAMPMDSDHVYVAMVSSCRMKACQLSQDTLKLLTSHVGNDHRDSATNGNVDGDAAKKKKKLWTVDDGIECQQAMAQIMEITIRLTLEEESFLPHHHHGQRGGRNGAEDTLAKLAKYYTDYQRHLLRHRSKPSIANLAAIRTLATNHSIPIMHYIHSTQQEQRQQRKQDGGNDDDEDDDDEDGAEKRPHANAITVILGEASSLIHPLLLWRDGICGNLHHLHEQNNTNNKHQQHPERDRNNGNNVNSLEMDVQNTLLRMCQETVETVHKEAQSLTSRVGEWFLKDAMDMIANINTNARNDSDNNPGNLNDENLDEMAFICQVLHRYIGFSSHHPLQHLPFPSKLVIPEREDVYKYNSPLCQHLTEHILNYTNTETRLISNHIQRAIELAQPVQIIMGMDRYVPSIVEDAYYISQRSLERAGTTLNERAICMMANWVVDVWSSSTGTGSDGGAVYQAIMEQKGCYVVKHSDSIGNSYNGDHPNGDMQRNHSHENLSSKQQKAPSSLNAFLSALDNDIVGGGVGTSGNGSTSGGGSARNSAPSSGTFHSTNSNMDVHQLQMDTQFCLLNGIHAASSACISLSKLFDTLLPEEENDDDDDGHPNASSVKEASTQPKSKEATMIILAMEQLQSHSKSYQTLLEEQITQFLQEWIGTVRNTHSPPPFIASLPQSPSLHRLFYYISNQEYNLTAETLRRAENEDNTMAKLLQTIRESRLMKELGTGKCDDGVTLCLLQMLSRQVGALFLSTLIHQKKFSEWGSLLLSRQIRALREFLCDVLRAQIGEGDDDDVNGASSGITPSDGPGSTTMNASLVMKEFQKLDQALMILQCGKPSEWITFRDEVGESPDFDLSKEEIRSVMGLRVDWSKDTIDAVCNK